MAKSLTSGSPARLIVAFAIPLLIGNLFQQLYNMADTLIVGRTLGVEALAAVGSTGSLVFLILGFAQAMTSGFSIVTAQQYGARHRAGVRKSFAVSICLCIGVGIVLTVISVWNARAVLVLMRTPVEILEDAYSYLRIIFLGIGVSIFFNLFSNTILALGDSKTPLFFLIIACILNIVLDLLFILVFSMGVAGAAWATVVAQIFAAGLCFLYIKYKQPALQLRRKDWQLKGRELTGSIRIGIPMGFQMSIIAIGAIILQVALNNLGPMAVAAYTVAQKIDILVTLPLMSFGLAMATYTGQNYGAGQLDRIRQGVRSCCIISLTFSGLGALISIMGGHVLIRLFTGEGQEGVLSLGQTYLNINGSMYWVLALLFIFRYTLQGLGKSLIPTVAGVMELIMRALAAIYLTRWLGFTGASLANPLAWIGSCVPLVWAYYVIMTKLEDTPQEGL